PSPEEACEDEAADPRRDARHDRQGVLERPVEAFRETQQDEHPDRAAELERHESVDRSLAHRDVAERNVADKERDGRDRERVHAGSSDFRNGTRSCTRTTRRWRSSSTTYAFGL